MCPATPETLRETRRCRPFPTWKPGAQPSLLTRFLSRKCHSTVVSRVYPPSLETLQDIRHGRSILPRILGAELDLLTRLPCPRPHATFTLPPPITTAGPYCSHPQPHAQPTSLVLATRPRPFWQWYMSDFARESTDYNCAEQFDVARKAAFFATQRATTKSWSRPTRLNRMPRTRRVRFRRQRISPAPLLHRS